MTLKANKNFENNIFETWTKNKIYDCLIEPFIISVRNNSGLYTQFERKFFESKMINDYFSLITK